MFYGGSWKNYEIISTMVVLFKNVLSLKVPIALLDISDEIFYEKLSFDYQCNKLLLKKIVHFSLKVSI